MIPPGQPASLFDTPVPTLYNPRPCGAVAQLGERLNGIQEVEGSIPFGSTKASIISFQVRSQYSCQS